MLENPRPRGSDASHSQGPAAVRCIRPPEVLGFPTQQPDEVLMAIIS